MRKTIIAGALLALNWAAPAWADGVRWDEGIGFYVGVDGAATLATGAYAGLANPNVGRLTLLFDHGNHFHGIGAYSYTGPAASATVAPTNANNRIPELFARTGADNGALQLAEGSGAFAGSWVSVAQGSEVNVAYGHLGLAGVQSLRGLSEAADVLYGSSGGRWSGVAEGVRVGLKLESITQGLKVAAGGDMDLFDTGLVHELGDLGRLSFQPVFHVDKGAAAGVYSASFSLVNLADAGSPVLSGGTFHLDFAVPAVPEPGAVAMLLAGVGVLAVARRRVSSRC